jgi:hypothetical protein
MVSAGPSSGTLLQLKLIGAEDSYTFLNPQATLWGPERQLRLRVSDFKCEPVETTFGGYPQLAFTSASASMLPVVFKCQVGKAGTVIGGTHLEMILPSSYASGEAIKYLPNFALNAIRYISVSVAGGELEKLTGDIIRCYLTAFEPKLSNNPEAQSQMFSGVPSEAGLLLTLPLPFFFSRSSLGSKLPVSSFYSMDVSISMCLSPLYNIIALRSDGIMPTSLTPIFTKIVSDHYHAPLGDVSSWYITPEVQSQLILQYQSQDAEVQPGADNGQSIMLNFNQPCRRLIWAVRNPQGNFESAPFVSCALTMNGVDVMKSAPHTNGTTAVDSKYFSLVQMHNFDGGKQVGGIHQYSFCLSNRFLTTGPALFANTALKLYPLVPVSTITDSMQFLSEQPNGSFDLSSTENYLQVYYSDPAPVPGSTLVVMAECYNVLQYSSGTFALSAI